ncbi:hypothetical protein [Nostoc sp.]|uniref:hypothetical protein n=1 Tax=Nostoc sp. TaxID=1180 RepID=UPI002FFBCE5E
MNRNCDVRSQFPVLLVSSFDNLELMGCDAYGGLHLSIGGANGVRILSVTYYTY